MSIDNKYNGPDRNNSGKNIDKQGFDERIQTLKEKLAKFSGFKDLENISPEQLLSKTVEFYNALFHKNFPDDDFKISVKKTADNFFTIELNRNPNDIFEEIKNKGANNDKSQYRNQQRKMCLIGTLLLDFEPTQDPLIITKQILNIIERFWQKETLGQ